MSTKRWWVGPPDASSKMTPVKFEPMEPEHQNIKVEREFRRKWKENFEWNHEFWSKHNKNFDQEQELYVQKLMAEKNSQRNQITADQMSEFYKKFLDDRLDQHWNYNWIWYRKNFELVWVSMKVHYFRIIRRFLKR